MGYAHHVNNATKNNNMSVGNIFPTYLLRKNNAPSVVEYSPLENLELIKPKKMDIEVTALNVWVSNNATEKG